MEDMTGEEVVMTEMEVGNRIEKLASLQRRLQDAEFLAFIRETAK